MGPIELHVHVLQELQNCPMFFSLKSRMKRVKNIVVYIAEGISTSCWMHLLLRTVEEMMPYVHCRGH